jgi:site-specific DNA-methyltransferase (adenine-specific)
MSPLPPKFRNKIFNCDVMDTLRALPNDCLDMVWGDPDYNVGINYNGAQYKTKWQQYIDWYIELTREAMRVLKPRGNLFMMNYPKQNAHLRVKYLDEAAHDVFDYVWVYPTNVGHSPRKFTTAHRSILHATKTASNKFYKDQVAQPYKNPTDKRILGRMQEGSLGRMQEGSLGRMPYSWMEYNLVKNVSREKTLHACQIPQALSELMIKSCTKEGDSIFILFGGSGSEVEVAKNLRRDFISCELHTDYFEIIQERISQGRIRDEHKIHNRRVDTPA